MRTPLTFVVNGPGIEAGSVFNANVVNYDLLPTFINWAGGDPTALTNIDGVSLASYMAGELPNLPMLFALSQDIGEFHNIAPAHPEEHRHLYDSMMQYFDDVAARIPKLNPDYDAAVYRSSKEYEKRVQWGLFAGSRPPAEDEK